MKILHVCQPTDGGAAVVVRQLAAAGVQAGDQVTVASPDEGFLPRWVTAAGGRWVELAMGRAPTTRDVEPAARLRAMFDDYDVVHLHSSKAGALGRLARRDNGGPPVVFTPHGWSWYVGGPAQYAYRSFEKWAALRADVITVVSDQELHDGRSRLGRTARFELIPNGVMIDEHDPLGPAAPRTSDPLVVQIGRLSRQKAQDRTIRSLAAMRDKRVRLRLVGNGPERANLVDLAASLGVLDRVDFVGATDPRPHIRAADLLVLPSRWEGMSLVLLEAMALGAPIIAADCGGSSALGTAGLTVPHASDRHAQRELTDAIDRLFRDDALRLRLGRQARERAVEEFDVNRTITRYRSLWSSLIGSARSTV